MLIQCVERIQFQERIFRDDAAGSLWAPYFPVEHGRVTDQPRTNFKVAQYVQSAVLDPQRFTFTQSCTAVADLNTVAAGIGEVKSTIPITDPRVVTGQMPFAVGDDPVTVIASTNHAAGLLEGLLAQLGWHELLGIEHFENQFHGDTPSLTCRD